MIQGISNRLRHNLWRGAVTLTEDRFNKYQKLKSWEELNAEEVENYQHQLLESVLTEAVTNVPYYRDTFRTNGLAVDGELTLDSIDKLPVLTKSDLQENFDRLKHDSIERFSWYVNRSGGSTGEPTKFIQCESYQYWSYAIATYLNERAYYRDGYPRVKLWGSERDVFDVDQSLRSKIGSFLRNETVLDAFTISDSDLDRYVRTINETQPVQIYTYVDAIHELSKHIARNDVSVHSPKSIMTTGGTLHPHIRSEIHDAFETEVFNRYGCREAGDIACECSAHDGLHVTAPFNYVEIVDEDGNPVEEREEGRILVTTLRNPAMPLIRYDTGDIGVKGGTDCSCGLAWPKIQRVSGRASDMIETSNGVVSPISFIHGIGVVLEDDSIEQYQVIQKETNEFIIKATHRGELNKSQLEEEIEKMIKQIVGTDTFVEVQLVDEIPPDPSGKYRYLKSEV